MLAGPNGMDLDNHQQPTSRTHAQWQHVIAPTRQLQSALQNITRAETAAPGRRRRGPRAGLAHAFVDQHVTAALVDFHPAQASRTCWEALSFFHDEGECCTPSSSNDTRPKLSTRHHIHRLAILARTAPVCHPHRRHIRLIGALEPVLSAEPPNKTLPFRSSARSATTNQQSMRATGSHKPTMNTETRSRTRGSRPVSPAQCAPPSTCQTARSTGAPLVRSGDMYHTQSAPSLDARAPTHGSRLKARISNYTARCRRHIRPRPLA